MNAPNNAGNPNKAINLDVNQRVEQLASAIAQIATVITQAKGVHVPYEAEKLGVWIPQVVIPRPNEQPARSNRN